MEERWKIHKSKTHSWSLKTNRMCKHAVKKIDYAIRYVYHQPKSQQMCDKSVL